MSAVVSAVVILGPIGAAACGGGGGSAPSAVTPASTPFDLPLVVSSGGPVLAAPRVQPIFFPGFAYADDVSTFLSRLSASAYWPAVAAEYGVGELTVLPGHTSSIPAAATVADSSLEALLGQVMTADAAELGALSRDTIYLLMFPATTTVTVKGTAMCQAASPSGFHTEFSVGGVGVAGVVVPSCAMYPGDATLTGVSALTPTISHEIVEAATDPYTNTAPAFIEVDERHAFWSYAISGGEVADLCENEIPNLIAPADIGYPVQRSWSNNAVMAGTGPCVPVPAGEIYFVAVPTLPGEVAVSRSGAHFLVPALIASVGAAAQVDVSLKSEGAGVAAWTVGALEFHSDSTAVPHPTGSSGRNGQSVRLGITPNEVAAGVFPLIIASATGPDVVHFWIGAIQRH